MKLLDVYNQLAYGELRQVVLGTGAIGNGVDGIPSDAYAKILPFVTLGLTEIHKRFNLREREIKIALQTGQVSYVITRDYAVSNISGRAAVKYLLDTTEDPFQEDLMKIERIYGVLNKKPYEIPLNEIDDPSSIRTNSFNMLLIPDNQTDAPWLKETTQLRVVYRADHPVIKTMIANASPLTTEIYLPNTHLMPLIWFIASRATNPNGITGEFHEGNNYHMKFEASVKQLQGLGDFAMTQISENTKLTSRGFV
jgi:hypothetical protein